MAVAKKKTEINLLPADKFAVSAFGRILNWLLSTFRFITIVVELLVMTAFLSRFWLDARNSDLSDEMEQKVALLASAQEFEQEFNAVKEKINIYTSISASEDSVLTALKKIPTILPEGITLDSLSLAADGTRLSGSAQTEEQISQFLVNLGSIKEYENPLLTQVSVDEETQLYLFKIDVP